MILDLEQVAEQSANETVDRLLQSSLPVRIIGISGQTDPDRRVAETLARKHGLALIPSSSATASSCTSSGSRGDASRRRPKPVANAAANAAAAAAALASASPIGDGESPSMLVRQSLRSGQHVYAQKGQSLCVLGSVHSGAEAWADGDVFVFGALRGRAFAGVSGNADSRIVCGHFNAELVSIADMYLAVEQTPDEVVPNSPTVCYRCPDNGISFFSVPSTHSQSLNKEQKRNL